MISYSKATLKWNFPIDLIGTSKNRTDREKEEKYTKS